MADGLAGNLEPGAVTVGIALDHERRGPHGERSRHPFGHGVLGHKMGLVLEGAGAVGVAALRPGVITPDADERDTVVLLTGRNVAPKLLSRGAAFLRSRPTGPC